MTPIRFDGKNAEFFSTLRSRINEYFNENNISPTGNWKLYLKTIIIGIGLSTNYLTLFLVPEGSAWVYVL